MGSLNWASGLIPLGCLYLRPLQRHFHSLCLTDRFTPPRRSDPLVLANLLRQWQDLRFLTSGIPICTFQADLTIFTDASTQGWGAHMGDSQISGTWTRAERKLHISCLELKAVISALQHWAPGGRSTKAIRMFVRIKVLGKRFLSKFWYFTKAS